MFTNGWQNLLQTEIEKPYFKQLISHIENEEKNGKIIYPKKEDRFRAFELTPFEKVSVVIIGQDPYHGAGEANGLAFSVNQGIKTPPSLRNIFTEIANDLGAFAPTNNDLSHWAKAGVLLINATLTVEANKAGSHQNLGWERFTDALIGLLSDKKSNLVFLLWGRFAQKKADLIDKTRHLILSSPHPSPLSVHKGFFGQKHFSTTNSYLKEHKKPQIPWQVAIS